MRVSVCACVSVTVCMSVYIGSVFAGGGGGGCLLYLPAWHLAACQVTELRRGPCHVTVSLTNKCAVRIVQVVVTHSLTSLYLHRRVPHSGT